MKFSIITPTHKRTHFLRQTIDSVIGQDGDFEIEYIICDSAVNPEVIKLVEYYSREISSNRQICLHCFSEKDEGQAEAINKGLTRSTGDLIAFINDDDYYEPGTFNKVAQAFTDPDVYWVYGKCRIVDKKGREIHKSITLYKNLLLHFNDPSILFSENYISQPTTFWRREVMYVIGYLNELEFYSMDYDYWLRLCKQFGIGHFINAYLANFRFHSASKTGAINPQEYKDALRVARKHGPNYRIPLILHYINCHKTILIYKILKYFRIE